MASNVTRALNQNNLGPPVTWRTYNFRDMAMRSWGSEFNAPDHGVYEFSGGRKFDSTDQGSTGIYGGGADQ
tara:strand:- start:1822 stop:2034 length:213 start_codon:yes stop_codon:yes gene_type:complete